MKKTKKLQRLAAKKQRKNAYLGNALNSLSREKENGYIHFEKWEEELKMHPNDAIRNLKLIIEKGNGTTRLYLRDWKGHISLGFKRSYGFLMFLASHKLVKEIRNKNRSVFYPK